MKPPTIGVITHVKIHSKTFIISPPNICNTLVLLRQCLRGVLFHRYMVCNNSNYMKRKKTYTLHNHLHKKSDHITKHQTYFALPKPYRMAATYEDRIFHSSSLPCTTEPQTFSNLAVRKIGTNTHS